LYNSSTNGNNNFYIGASAYHLNHPKVSFLGVDTINIPTRVTVHGGGFFPIVGSWSVYLPVACWLAIFRDAPGQALVMVLIGFFVNTIYISTFLRPKIAAERSKVERNDDMAVGQFRRDPPRRFKFDQVALAVIDGERDDGETGLARQGGADHRIEPAREEDDCGLHSLMPIRGAAQNQAA